MMKPALLFLILGIHLFCEILRSRLIDFFINKIISNTEPTEITRYQFLTGKSFISSLTVRNTLPTVLHTLQLHAVSCILVDPRT